MLIKFLRSIFGLDSNDYKNTVSSGDQAGRSTTINGITYRAGRNIVVRNDSIWIDGKRVDAGKKEVIVKVILEGNATTIESDVSVEIHGNVYGDVSGGNSVECKDVGGNVDAGNSVTCKDIKGKCRAGNSIIRGTK